MQLMCMLSYKEGPPIRKNSAISNGAFRIGPGGHAEVFGRTRDVEHIEIVGTGSGGDRLVRFDFVGVGVRPPSHRGSTDLTRPLHSPISRRREGETTTAVARHV